MKIIILIINESSFKTDREKHGTQDIVQIIVSDNQLSFKTRFNPLLYSPNNGTSWVKLRIPEGSYEIDDINNTIHHEMEKRGRHDSTNEDYYINISANS